MKRSPYHTYQLFPVLTALALFLLLILILWNGENWPGNIALSSAWLLCYAYFKLRAPAFVRNKRVIWYTICLQAAMSAAFWFVIAGFMWTGTISNVVIWLPGLLLLILEYCWPFPPETAPKS